MMVLVVRCLVVTGRRSWNVLAGVHRRVCVQLKSDTISPREGLEDEATYRCLSTRRDSLHLALELRRAALEDL